MPYKQYTHCVSKEEWTGLWSGQMIGGVVLTALGVIAALMAGGAPALLLLLPGGMMTIASVCGFLLGGKLICLGHDKCAVGQVVELEPPGYGKSFPETIDNDYSINISLGPHKAGHADKDVVANDQAHGYLIAEPDFAEEIGFDFKGYHTLNKGAHPVNSPVISMPVLHCEFEGGRIVSVCDALSAMGTLIALGALFCAIPFIGWIACAIAAIIIAIVLLAAWHGAHDGTPDDANPGMGELHVDQDYVIVRGDWTLDTGHEPGWNELHPVTHVQKVQPLRVYGPDCKELPPPQSPISPPWKEGSTTAAVNSFKLYLDWACEQTHRPREPEVQDEQKHPRSRWCLHPDVDGCEPEEEFEVPIPK